MSATLTRREFIRMAAFMAAGGSLAGCASVYDRLAPDPGLSKAWPDSDPTTFLRLNRMTFGPRAEERDRAEDIGLEAWIEEQLAPDGIDDIAADLRIRRFATLEMSAADLAEVSDRLFDNVDRNTVPDQLRQATLIRQVYSRRQLLELMVEFWTDHFNISVEKGDCFFLKTVDDRQVIRKHALGRFGDLLMASAHSPAMLVYLDNQSNRKGAPNENYARELMELHTLGVEGGYTQSDVMELARCLTGWTVKQHFWRGEFTFDDKIHDAGAKDVLGMHIEPAGEAEASRILGALVSHRSTAHFVSRKLVQRFVDEDPPAELVEHVAAVFIRTDGDIRSMLRTVLLDGWRDIRPKFKRPANFVVSALRMLGAHTEGGRALQDYLKRMGQPSFGWPTPDGYPDRSDVWSSNLMPRWQFAFDLAHGDLPGTRFEMSTVTGASVPDGPYAMLDHLSTLLLGKPMPPETSVPLLDMIEALGTLDGEDMPRLLLAAVLASPAFQWR
jgi:hypothetical protein